METLSRSTDLDILRLKAETNRIEVAAYLALQQLEQIERDVRALVRDLKARPVLPSSDGSSPEET